MPLKLYNTLSRSMEVFKPRRKDRVLYYTCGPTVHDYAHIGNFRTFVVQDVLKRWLQVKGYIVRHVMNITDVDEKTIERAARKKIPLSELTKKFEEAFFEDLDCLNITRADHYPRVSDNIDTIAEMVEVLMERGHAFRDSEGSIYYNVNTFPAYGMLSGRRPKRRIRATMPREDYSSPKNFLLWKACEAGHEGDGCWKTSVGTGMPGWHIECAALANKYLGETIDIHSGGVDLVFPHHENEIAEAEGATGTMFSRFWVHVEHLVVYGEKMSKSKGNFYTLRQVVRRGYDPMAIRLIYLKTHYRSKLDFDFDMLKSAEKELEGLKDFLRELGEIAVDDGSDYEKEIDMFRREFTGLMDNDFQTQVAWDFFLEFIGDAILVVKNMGISSKGAQSIIDAASWVDSIFGVLEGCELTQ